MAKRIARKFRTLFYFCGTLHKTFKFSYKIKIGLHISNAKESIGKDRTFNYKKKF